MFEIQVIAAAKSGDVQPLLAELLPYLKKELSFKVRPSDVDDLAQDIALQVITKIGSLNDGFKGWLSAIIHNKVVSHYRARQTRQTSELSFDLEGDNDGLADNLIKKERNARLNKIISSLLPHEQDVLKRHYVNEERTADIGKDIGRPASTIRRWLVKSRNKIKEQLM